MRQIIGRKQCETTFASAKETHKYHGKYARKREGSRNELIWEIVWGEGSEGALVGSEVGVVMAWVGTDVERNWPECWKGVLRPWELGSSYGVPRILGAGPRNPLYGVLRPYYPGCGPHPGLSCSLSRIALIESGIGESLTAWAARVLGMAESNED